MSTGKDLGHVHAVQRKLKTGGDGLHAKTFSAAGNAHHEQAFRHDLRADVVTQLEELAPLHQPSFEAFEATHIIKISARVDKLDHAAAIHEQPLLFEHRGQ
jgi:hypothetical protein